MRTLHKIDEELKKQKKTQKELCDFIGVKKSVYSDWNSGKNQSYRKHINKIAQFLNVSTDYLLGNSEISSISRNPEKPNVTDEDIKFALFGGATEVTDKMYEDVKRFAKFLIEKEKKENGET